MSKLNISRSMVSYFSTKHLCFKVELVVKRNLILAKVLVLKALCEEGPKVSRKSGAQRNFSRCLSNTVRQCWKQLEIRFVQILLSFLLLSFVLRFMLR